MCNCDTVIEAGDTVIEADCDTVIEAGSMRPFAMGSNKVNHCMTGSTVWSTLAGPARSFESFLTSLEMLYTTDINTDTP